MKKTNFGFLALVFAITYIVAAYGLIRFFDIEYFFYYSKASVYFPFVMCLLGLSSLVFNSDNQKSLKYTAIGFLVYLLPQFLMVFHFNLLFFRFI